MAENALDWVPEAVFRDRLGLPNASPDQILTFAATAVAWAGEVTKLPLLDTTRTFSVAAGRDSPLKLQGIAYPDAAAPIVSLDAIAPDGTATAITRIVNGEPAPDYATFDRLDSDLERFADYELRTGTRWPDAWRYRVGVRVGMLPDEHPTLAHACLTLCRMLYAGMSDPMTTELLYTLIAAYVPPADRDYLRVSRHVPTSPA